MIDVLNVLGGFGVSSQGKLWLRWGFAGVSFTASGQGNGFG